MLVKWPVESTKLGRFCAPILSVSEKQMGRKVYAVEFKGLIGFIN